LHFLEQLDLERLVDVLAELRLVDDSLESNDEMFSLLLLKSRQMRDSKTSTRNVTTAEPTSHPKSACAIQ
jgi:hypothetical protein